MIIDGEKYCCSFSEKLRLGNMLSICSSNLLESEFEYAYKRYPLDTGRKLNILFTFNLGPVTKGYAYQKTCT